MAVKNFVTRILKEGVDQQTVITVATVVSAAPSTDKSIYDQMVNYAPISPQKLEALKSSQNNE
ncbi:MAG: hypothetical protein HPY53_03450 [Brevinematales bacterium]|nr:hypothetical protein [Brevinematales bacterium]